MAAESAHHERLLPGGLDAESAIEHLHRYAFAAELFRGREVLDAACGEGYGSALLARTAKRVTGVDLDASAVAAAGEKYRAENLRFVAGSVTALPLEAGSVDAIASFETLEHLREHEQMLAEFRRVLRPGGLLLISTPERVVYTEAAHYQNPFHVRELKRAEFEALLRGTFTTVALLGQDSIRGSLVAPLTGDTGGFIQHAGDFSDVSSERGLSRPRYVLAACSDAELPMLPASFFSGAVELMSDVTVAQVLHVLPNGKALPWWRRLLRRSDSNGVISLDETLDCRIRSFSVALRGRCTTDAQAIRARVREKSFDGRLEGGRFEIFANLGSGTHSVTISILTSGGWWDVRALRVNVPEVHFEAR